MRFCHEVKDSRWFRVGLKTLSSLSTFILINDPLRFEKCDRRASRGHNGPHWAALGRTGLHWAALGCNGQH